MKYTDRLRESNASLLDAVTTTILVVAAFTWGLEAVSILTDVQVNVFQTIFADASGLPQLEAAVYLLFAAAGAYQVYRGFSLYESR